MLVTLLARRGRIESRSLARVTSRLVKRPDAVVFFYCLTKATNAKKKLAKTSPFA